SAKVSDSFRRTTDTMLLNHFQEPLASQRHWSGFHSCWATNLAVDINQQLPDGWFAEPQVRWSVEIDVATFEESEQMVAASVAPATTEGDGNWKAPSPYKTIDFDLRTDEVEVRIFRDMSETPLVGMVELVSPANKSGPDNREAFVSKCDSYLRDAIGLAIIDIVTEPPTNVHSLLVQRFGDDDQADDILYASA